MTRRLLPVLLLCFSALVSAQDISYGFRAGLNFSKLDGPLETDEQFNLNSGFHIGFGFGYWLTDIWGVRGELAYSQKGLKYVYDGPGYAMLTSESGRVVNFIGNREVVLNITNSYIDLPVTAFARVTNWLELSAGMTVGFLINPTGTGDFDFTGTQLDMPVKIELDYNYYSDAAGEADFTNSTLVTDRRTGEQFEIPSIAGAYYFFEEKPGSYFNVLDLAAVGGIAFYLNQGLYLSGRFQYGLVDATNDDADFSQRKLDTEGNRISRGDKDTNWTIQTSIGFNF